MVRKLRIFGLTVAAVLALGAATGSAAQAAPFFRVVETPTTIQGEKIAGEQVFNTSAGKTECTKSQWSGTTIKQSTSLTLRTSYSNCTLNKEAATVEVNGCEYNFTLVDKSSPPTATVDLICSTAPKEMTIKTANCVIHIEGNQFGLKHATFATNETKELSDVDMTLAVSGIKYTATPGCPGSHLTQSNGEYKETVTLKGVQDEGGKEVEVPFWIEP